MKYNLPFINNTKYIPTIATMLLITMAHLMFISDSSAQTRPYDNGEIATLQKSSLQNDSYYSNNKFKSTNQHNLSTLLRYGIAKNYELQFGWAAQKDKSDTKNFTSESTNVGVKIHLTSNSKYLPALAAVVSTNLTFDPAKSPFNPSINLLFDKTLNSTWCLNGNVQLSIDEQAGDLTNNYSFNIEAAVTTWQTTYVGLTGNSDPFQSAFSTYQQYLEIGMLFWVYDGIVLYPFYDVGLNDSTGDIFNIGALFTLGN